jgi:hypothetical protein
MQGPMRRACHATKLARERGVALKPGLMALIERLRSGPSTLSWPFARYAENEEFQRR